MSERDRAWVQVKMGHCLRLSGRLNEAVAILQQAKIPVNQGPPASESDRVDGGHDARIIEADRLLELGCCEANLASHEQALKRYEEARTLYVAAGNRQGEGVAHAHLGKSYGETGQLTLAEEAHRAALVIGREVGDLRSVGMALGSLASLARERGAFAESIDLSLDALSAYQQSEDTRGETVTLGNLGNVYLVCGELDQALSFYQQGLTQAHAIGDSHIEATYTGYMGLIHEAHGRNDDAHSAFQAAAEIFRVRGDTIQQGVWEGNAGDSLMKLGRLEEAEVHLRQAIDSLSGRLEVAAGAFSGSLALLLAQGGRLAEAKALLSDARSSVAPDPNEHLKFLVKSGQVLHISGDRPGAIDALNDARRLITAHAFTEDSANAIAVRELAVRLGVPTDTVPST